MSITYTLASNIRDKFCYLTLFADDPDELRTAEKKINEKLERLNRDLQDHSLPSCPFTLNYTQDAIGDRLMPLFISYKFSQYHILRNGFWEELEKFLDTSSV